MAKASITNMEVKKNNRNRIYRYICNCQTVSNPDISYALKISLPTVTQNTRELIEMGLVREIGELQSTGGRRAKALAAAADYRLAVGIDITQNHIGLLLADLAGTILKYDRAYFPFRKTRDYFEEVSGKLEEFLTNAAAGRERILGIGISFPGIVNLQKQEITNSHALGISALSFADVSGCFAYPCFFLNDANAGAYAEGVHSEKTGSFFYLSLSNTVGGSDLPRGTADAGQGIPVRRGGPHDGGPGRAGLLLREIRLPGRLLLRQMPFGACGRPAGGFFRRIRAGGNGVCGRVGGVCEVSVHCGQQSSYGAGLRYCTGGICGKLPGGPYGADSEKGGGAEHVL